jgi:hypothetical protein
MGWDLEWILRYRKMKGVCRDVNRKVVLKPVGFRMIGYEARSEEDSCGPVTVLVVREIQML